MQNNISWKSFIIYVLMMILLSNCSVKKQISADSDEVFINQLEQLVQCLNERKVDCLQNIYSPNYSSFSPVMEINSIDEFINLTVDNMAKNNYQVAAQITELEIGMQYAYVRLNWKLIEPANGEFNLVIDEKRLDIWRMEEGKWHLYRSLFYKEFGY